MNNYQDLMIREKTKLNIMNPIKLIKDKIEKNKIKQEKLIEEQQIHNEWINKINNPKVIKFEEQFYNFLLNEVKYPMQLVFNANSINKYGLNNIEELAEMLTIVLFNDKYNLISCGNHKNGQRLKDIIYQLKDIKKQIESSQIEWFPFVYQEILNILKKENLVFCFKRNEFEVICKRKKDEKAHLVMAIIGGIFVITVITVFLYILG